MDLKDNHWLLKVVLALIPECLEKRFLPVEDICMCCLPSYLRSNVLEVWLWQVECRRYIQLLCPSGFESTDFLYSSSFLFSY
jgi:hypothetical protein